MSMEPLVKKFKARAPKQYEPPFEVKDAGQELLRVQGEIRELVCSADGFDLARGEGADADRGRVQDESGAPV